MSTDNNIWVAVRVRPISQSESLKSTTKTIEVLDSNVLILFDPTTEKSEVPRIRNKEKQYAFDIVLNEQATQEQVFLKTTQFLLDGVVNGYNASVFAYGPTGAGKTYTMIGTSAKPGVMFHTFTSLFSQIEKNSKGREYKVCISYLEIYNENIRDLLNPSLEVLDIREDSQKGIVIAGLTEILTTSPSTVFDYVRKGNRRRISEPTMANKTSSRSHGILQVTVEYRALGSKSEICIGKLSLIDLAGSERAANTQNRGIRLLEGASINKSLLALGNCINALCELNEKACKIYVPYRDSKLTRLLKDSLGGNCRTVMITCISPCSTSYEDTYNTLIYANRAKHIKTKAEKNSLNVQVHISKYTTIIKELKSEVIGLRNQLANSVNESIDIEKFLIEISKHFQEEALCRKGIYENEQNIDNLGFAIFAKQAELMEISAELGEDSEKFANCKAEADFLTGNVKKFEKKVKSFKKKVQILEKNRELMELQWKIAGIPDPHISQLALEMKKHSIMMSSLDVEGKESHNKLIIEQKDMYIKLLEDQLRLRDSFIIAELPSLDRKTLKKLKSFDKINSHFGSIHSLSSSPSKKIRISLLKSRIPMPKKTIFSSETPKPTRSSIILKKTPSHNELKYSNHYKSRNRANSIESRLSDTSAASTYIDKSSKIARISEKYSSSPYVKSVSKVKLH